MDVVVNGIDTQLFVAKLLLGCPVIPDATIAGVPGDMNQDGTVNGLDIQPFASDLVGR